MGYYFSFIILRHHLFFYVLDKTGFLEFIQIFYAAKRSLEFRNKVYL